MPAVVSDYLAQQLLIDSVNHTVAGNFSGIFFGSVVNLFVANIIPTKNNVFADFAPPTYTGYAPVAAGFGAPSRRPSGGIAMQTALMLFQESTPFTTVSVYGYMIGNAGATQWLTAELFPGGPLQLFDALSAISFIAEFAIGGPDFGTMSLVS